MTICVTGTTCVEPLKRLEKTVDLGGRDDRSSVGDRQNGLSILCGGGYLYAASGDVVPDCVVDQIANKALDEVRVSLEGRRSGIGMDVDPESVAIGSHDAKDCLNNVGQVDELVPFHSTLAAGESQESFDESFLLPIGNKQFFAG